MSSHSLFSLVREIRYYIANAETESALELALSNMQEHKRLNELILQNAQLIALKQDKRTGSLGKEHARIGQNQIN